MEVRFWAATDVGLTRDHNEDNFLVDKKLNLFIVADGMGGHAAGEVASSVAVREVRRVLSEHREVLDEFAANDTPQGREAVLNLIETAISAACASVFKLAEENPNRRGMGTTLSLLMLIGNRGFIGHVGDSRIYLLRTGRVHQLTEDHSLVNELIKRGRMKPGEAFDSPYKNAVTRAVGVYETVEVDAFDIDVLPDDRYLLCSDGLSCYLNDENTVRLFGEPGIKEAPGILIDHANKCGGKDNITVIAVELVASDLAAQAGRVNMVRRKTEVVRAQSLFKYLNYREIVRLMNSARRLRFSDGEVIYQEGKRFDALLLLLSGKVSLSRRGRFLTELGPDSALGESILIEDGPRTETVKAEGQVEMLSIPRKQIHLLMRQDGHLANKIIWGLLQILHARLLRSNAELMNAFELVEALNQGETASEMPVLDPSLMGVGALPVGVTDEVAPGFLFASLDLLSDGSAGSDDKESGE